MIRLPVVVQQSNLRRVGSKRRVLSLRVFSPSTLSRATIVRCLPEYLWHQDALADNAGLPAQFPGPFLSRFPILIKSSLLSRDAKIWAVHKHEQCHDQSCFRSCCYRCLNEPPDARHPRSLGRSGRGSYADPRARDWQERRNVIG